MGDEALEVVEEVSKTEVPEIPEVPKEGAEETEKTEEFEVVLDDEGSQPGENRGIRRRINKLNARVKTAQEDQSATAQALEAKTQEAELYKLALDQAKTSKAPNPNDFDDGAADAKFVEASEAHIQSLVNHGVQQAVSNLPKSDPVDHGLRRNQEAHYERADKLGIKDYDEAEDEAISILGQNTVNEIINVSDKSHIILHYFGKNPRRAEAFADLVADNPVKAATEIGRLEERLKVKPLAKTQQAEPDEELEGGTSTSDGAYTRQLEKLRDAAAESGNMDDVIAFKRKHRQSA